jgi:hypothetical protein
MAQLQNRPSHPAYANPNFNPSIDYVIARKTQLKIAFVHVGKCAGESIMTAIKNKIPNNYCDIYEYHCFDANKLIDELINARSVLPTLHYIICTRDPLERWISAFNWDKHNLGILNETCGDVKLMELYKSYPTVDQLAKALLKQPQNNHAVQLSRAAHMGMGISWYLPLDIFIKIKEQKVYTIRSEHIEKDTESVIKLIMDYMGMPISADFHSRLLIPKTKHDYQARYPAETFKNLDGLFYSEIKRLKQFLSNDYESHEAALKFSTLHDFW